MVQQISLARQFLGLTTRIECSLRPLNDDSGRWMIVFAAGVSDHQPTSVQAQGPFYGANEALMMLKNVVDNLLRMDYSFDKSPFIWSLHAHAELKKVAQKARCALS